MRITQEADYALRITTLLSRSDAPIGASELADKVKAPNRFAMKLLRKLALAGVVTSLRGATGGYKLAMPADKLTVKQVIEVIDGKIEISKCLSDCHECLNNPDKGVCRFHNVFAYLNEQLTSRLDMLTIAQMGSNELSIDQLIDIIR